MNKTLKTLEAEISEMDRRAENLRRDFQRPGADREGIRATLKRIDARRAEVSARAVAILVNGGRA